jgi:hypothetical protein
LRLEGDEGVGVAATLPRYPAVEPGARIRVDGPIRAPPEGPYGDYLRRTGVTGTLRTRSLEVLPGNEDLGTALERLRRHADAALAAAIPEPEAGLASGIVIGLRDRVDRDLAADFTTVGASHVVAISGWNIAIVAACIAALCGRLSRRRRALVTAAAIVLYVAFAGASASVVRAAAMAGVVIVAHESGRAGRAAFALGWAALLLLLVDPHLVSDAGFQLSSLATAGISPGHACWGVARGGAAAPGLAHRVPRGLARRPGRDAAGGAAVVWPARDCVADRESRRRAARRAGDGCVRGRADPRARDPRRRSRGGRDDPRPARLVPAVGDRRGRPGGCCAAVRECDARAAMERGRGGRRGDRCPGGRRRTTVRDRRPLAAAAGGTANARGDDER